MTRMTTAVCPCDCHTAPPEPVQPVQLDLFGAAAKELPEATTEALRIRAAEIAAKGIPA